MKKLLLLTMAVLTLALPARAADGDTFIVDNLKYRVISETDRTVSLTAYVESPIGELIIPSEIIYLNKQYFVREIGNSAFAFCHNLTSVNIPNSITKIGGWAFAQCGFRTIDLPTSLTKIEPHTFYDCMDLKSVNIPTSVTEIGNSAFSGCQSLTYFTLPGSVTQIGTGAFDHCTSLISVLIPKSVTRIEDGPFFSCTSLEKILVEEGNPNYTSDLGCLLTIDGTTLVQCPGSMEQYVIPNSVTKIGGFAFAGSNLTSMAIPTWVANIGQGAFQECYNLKSVTIPTSTTILDHSIFADCRSLTSIRIPESVTEIRSGAFSGCVSLSSVNIPGLVTKIGENAFSRCIKLPSIDIPSSITSISAYAFANCSSLKEFRAFPSTPPNTLSNAFQNVPTDAVVYIPFGTLSAYSTAEGWNYFTDFREMESGIDDVETDAEVGPAEYYNLNGMRVGGDRLATGVYIKRQGGKASKVVVK